MIYAWVRRVELGACGCDLQLRLQAGLISDNSEINMFVLEFMWYCKRHSAKYVLVS